jgi:hypothetical protein
MNHFLKYIFINKLGSNNLKTDEDKMMKNDAQNDPKSGVYKLLNLGVKNHQKSTPK